MTTTPKPEPASDDLIEALRDAEIAYRNAPGKTLPWWASPLDNLVWGLSSCISRIDSDRARIREQAEEIAVFKQSIAGTYPVNTMCCDGHERILFYSDFETCPLCAALSKPEPR